jgi:hypothetical protein
MHHGMEVRLGLSKGPICPSFNWSIHVVLQYIVRQSSTSVNRPYYHGEKWKPMSLAPVQCSV